MSRDPRVTAYLANAAPFARPVLRHLRSLIHGTCPEVEEAIKWSHPSFLWRGKILCFFAAFKAHVAFGFWRQEELEKRMLLDGVRGGGAMGNLGRIKELSDLPPDAAIQKYLVHAMKTQEAGVGTPAKRKSRPPLPVPADLAGALKRNRQAEAHWADFSPSARRDYVEWITEARREGTREQRLLTTVEWVAEGKKRHWKHQTA